MNVKQTTPIPGPRELPLIGNIADIKDPSVPLWSLHDLAKTYGEIYQLRFPGQNPCLFINSVALTDEVCDEKRFRKKIGVLLGYLRRGMRDCVFTCQTDQEEWQVAHRILMPAFGPLSIRAMFDEMHDIAGQLALKWARQGPKSAIPVANDFTCLSLDTLALCSMGFRFNSYYQPRLHPFVEAMCEFLVEADAMCRRLPLPAFMFSARDEKFQANIELMREIAGEVCIERRSATAAATATADRKDLLGAMLKGVDPVTGKTLTDNLIIDNLIGFLIAGHETTSGMLSFAFYLLLRHPDKYRRAQDEVDSVCGSGAVTLEHMSQLPYVAAVLRETLRLLPTIPGFMVEPLEDTTIGGRNGKAFPIKKGQTITCLLAPVHNDESVWGPDASEFEPERMLEDAFNQRLRDHPNCWKPFGNGVRACPGRNFAWQESLLICAILLQNFDFVAQDADYELSVTQNITIKPKDYYMRATLRHGLTPTTLEHRLFGKATGGTHTHTHTVNGNGSGTPTVISLPNDLDNNNINNTMSNQDPVQAIPPCASKPKPKPITILYGSESGTCESLARKLANDAATHGFQATKIDALDSLDMGTLISEYTITTTTSRQVQQQPAPIIIVTASYEGKPPANARRFIEAIEAQAQTSSKSPTELGLSRLNFAVYGCGDRAWATTFHHIPKMVDSVLEELGARRLAPMGLVDVAGGGVDAVVNFEAWEDELLWPALIAKYAADEGTQSGSEVTAPNVKRSSAGSDSTTTTTVVISTTALDSTKEAIVVNERVLTALGHTPAKRHLEVCLPEGMSYRPGDHLALMPLNSTERVDAIMNRFKLDESNLLLSTSHLMNPKYMSVRHVLSRHVELSLPATKRNILTLAASTSNSSTKDSLARMASNKTHRISVFELLEQFPDISISLASFLVMLPPLRPRLYSISSSSQTHATLTYSVKLADDRAMGLATSYMSSLQPGDKVNLAIRPSHGGFHLPAPESTTHRPLICIAAGTGIAPFRGFVQERAAATATNPAPMLIFFGCRSHELDDLYRGELDALAESANVEMFRAYSRQPTHADAGGCRHVQDRLLREWIKVKELWDLGAIIYVCGPRALSDAIREVFVKMRMEEVGFGDRAIAMSWFERVVNPRFNIDVFD